MTEDMELPMLVFTIKAPLRLKWFQSTAHHASITYRSTISCDLLAGQLKCPLGGFLHSIILTKIMMPLQLIYLAL